MIVELARGRVRATAQSQSIQQILECIAAAAIEGTRVRIPRDAEEDIGARVQRLGNGIQQADRAVGVGERLGERGLADRARPNTTNAPAPALPSPFSIRRNNVNRAFVSPTHSFVTRAGSFPVDDDGRGRRFPSVTSPGRPSPPTSRRPPRARPPDRVQWRRRPRRRWSRQRSPEAGRRCPERSVSRA